MSDIELHRRLEPLLSALAEGSLSDEQREQLRAELRGDAAARRYYARYMFVHGALAWRDTEPLAGPELATDEPQPARRTLRGWWHPVRDFVSHPTTLSLTVSGLFVTVVLLSLALIVVPPWHEPARPLDRSRIVAEVFRTREAVWSSASLVGGNPPRDLYIGEPLELRSGSVAVRFDSGALAMIEGPATFTAEGKNRLQIQGGTLAARVPRRAIGFLVSTPTVEVIDLGTEFSLRAEETETEVHVIRGSVEVQRVHSGAGKFARVMAAGQAAKFGNSETEGFYVKETEMNKTIFLGMMAMAVGVSAGPAQGAPLYFAQDASHVDADGNAYMAWDAALFQDATISNPTVSRWTTVDDTGSLSGTALQATSPSVTTPNNTVTYNLKFATEGTYSLYFRGRADVDEQLSSADSWLAPGGGFGDPTPNVTVDGWKEAALMRLSGSGNNSITASYNWFRQGGPDASDFGHVPRIDFTVTSDDVAEGEILTLTMGARENFMTIDRWILSTNSNLFSSTAGDSMADLNAFSTATAVPEPAAAALGLLGAAGVILLVLRRRRKLS